MTALDAAAALAPRSRRARAETAPPALQPRRHHRRRPRNAGIVPDFIWDRLDVKELPSAAALGASNVLEVAAASEGWPPFVLEQLRADSPERPTPPSASGDGGSALPVAHGCVPACAATTATRSCPPRRPPRATTRAAVAQEMNPRRRVGPALRRLHREDVARCAAAAAAAATARNERAITAPMATSSTTTSSRSRCSTRRQDHGRPVRRPAARLGLSLKKVQFHLRRLGCAMAKNKADADKGATIATLSYPLAPPRETAGANGRR